MEKDIYNPPKADLNNDATLGQLASRWARLFGSIIDSLIMGIAMLPLMYFTGYFDGITEGNQPSLIHAFALGLVGCVIFVLINWRFLKASGQTIGKKALSIKIVTDGDQLPEISTLLKRYGVYFGLSIIPIIGGLLSLLNIVFIFGNEKKCLHDRAAVTKVVKA